MKKKYIKQVIEAIGRYYRNLSDKRPNIEPLVPNIDGVIVRGMDLFLEADLSHLINKEGNNEKEV